MSATEEKYLADRAARHERTRARGAPGPVVGALLAIQPVSQPIACEACGQPTKPQTL